MRLGLVALLLVAATACGGGESAKVEAASEPTPSSTLAPVSDATACQLLYPGEGDGPLGTILDLLNADSPTLDDLTAANDALDTLKQLVPVTPEPLHAQLVAHNEIVGKYLDELNASGVADIETTQLKAVALEIASICTEAIS